MKQLAWSVVPAIVCAVSPPSLRADPPVTVNQLLVAWQNNWAALSDLEVVYAIESTGPAHQFEEGLIPSAQQLLRWGSGRFYGRCTRPGGRPKEDSFDYGAPEGRLRYIGMGAWRGSARFDGSATAWMANQLRSPGPSGSLGWSWMQDLAAILGHPGAAVRPQVEWLDGQATAVVDVFDTDRRLMTVWLDMARSSVPLRWAVYEPGGQPFVSVSLRDYMQVGGAVWLATLIEYSWVSGDMAGVVTTQRVVPDDQGQPQLKINSGLGPEELTVHFPNREIVYDDDTGQITQMVAAAGSTRDLSRRLAEAVEEHSCTRGCAIVGAGKHVWTAPRSGLLLLVAAGVGAGLRLRRS